MVMSIVTGDPDRIAELGVKDSKKLSPTRRSYLSAAIRNEFSYEIRVIDSQEINRFMQHGTLNELEKKAAIELISHSQEEVYVDSFDVNQERLSDELSRSTGRKVVCLHKADERIPAVSAASIISKVERDRIVGEIARIYGNVGSGYPSDPVTIEFLRKAISAGSDLSKIVRVRWETYRRLKEEVETRRLL